MATVDAKANVLKATKDDFDVVCDITAKAFADDPVLAWMVRRDDGRQAAIRLFIVKMAETIYFPHDEVYLNEAHTGATMWLPPGGKTDMGLWQTVMSLPAIIKIGKLSGIRRMLRVQDLVSNKHPHEPHYYLFTIGALPELRGQGIGSCLMKPMLERCDREGTPAYLENSREANLAFYQKHGFEVTEELTMPDGPTMWLMLRKPNG